MKILIVDDDPQVRSFLSDGIGMAAAEVIHTAESGEEALAKAIQMQYDLVTLDITMSGVTGSIFSRLSVA
jgi:twitching motility two-component system response regulator PilH